MNVAAVIGNPKLGSRTRAAAELVAQRLTGTDPASVVEVAEFGPQLLGWGDSAITALKAELLSADLVIFASPTFKGTYSGLLKLLLDQFGAGEFADTTAIPLMLGAGLQHALAPELSLKPVLVEIGCSCPTPALYLLDSDFATSPLLEAWVLRARVSLRGLVKA